MSGDVNVVDVGQTGAVIVFYHPDVRVVERANVLAKWLPVVAVDNTPGQHAALRHALSDRIALISNGANLGIATAINQGVDWLAAAGFRFALLFDQDSEPSKDHVERLPRVMAALLEEGRRVAVVGPAYYDERLGGVAPFVKFGFFRLKRVTPSDDRPVDVDFLISSGSCINLASWDEIGPMQDDLFIDFVDLEWCVRAKRRGFAVLGVSSVVMRHNLGDEPVRALGRSFAMHSPIRHYYLFRNAVALACRRDIPVSWKTSELVKLPVRLVVYGGFADCRREHIRMAFSGIWDGLRKRLGERDSRR